MRCLLSLVTKTTSVFKWHKTFTNLDNSISSWHVQSFVSTVYRCYSSQFDWAILFWLLPQIMKVNINQKTRMTSDLNLSVNLIFGLHKGSFSTFT